MPVLTRHSTVRHCYRSTMLKASGEIPSTIQGYIDPWGGSGSCRILSIRPVAWPPSWHRPAVLRTYPHISVPHRTIHLAAMIRDDSSILTSSESVRELAQANQVDTSSARWAGWRAAVLRAAETEMRFVEPKRQEIWSIVYQSPTAKLELSLHPKQPEWRLFAFPEEHEPANAEIRKVLNLPVGRFVCNDGLFSGRWEFALPTIAKIDITIEGSSELVPAWEQKLGLQGDEFRNKVVHAQLDVQVPEEHRALFDRDISGTYTLIDKCGTANSALHKRTQTEADGNLPPIFLLLDPTRCGRAEPGR
ncbi:hypothetical protein NUW54_g6485 [Trametes sanguinea]|uniref:Uncharacterized protein n=1 Tax=Trametes sanguinea TaxID=158606 RepID=A0ACC1PT42_9APHY|nr:hypothetical protein NUW54_g6485 [Trametes sanguinea]